MFTGIVEELGTVEARRGPGRRRPAHRPRPRTVLEDAGLGDSIAVNGCCLTVAERDGETFTADVMQRDPRQDQPRRRSRPATGSTSSAPSPPTTRLGGHIVQGHVDGTGTVVGRTPGEHWEVVEIALPAELARYVVEKGSITVDGVSLTVVEAGDDCVHGQPDPETLARTTLGLKQRRRPGQPRGRRHRQVRREAARRGHRRRPSEPDRASTTRRPARHASSDAIADIAAGRPVVVVDDEDRENEGDLIFAAEKATPELMAFTIRTPRGVICVPMHGADARPARPPADDAAQQGPDADGVHRLRRRPRRRHHRHLAPPTGRTPSGCSPTRRPSRASSPGPATSSRCATARAACWSAAATPRPPSTWPGWPG